MREILSNENTKRNISVYFMNQLEKHLRSKNSCFIIAENWKTIRSSREGVTRNTRKPIPMIRFWSFEFGGNGRLAVVHTNDTDVFVLLLKYSSTLAYKELCMKWKAGDYIDINKIATNLGESICNSHIGIHSSTGCDTVENISIISKEMSFLNNEADIIQSLSQIPLAVPRVYLYR